MSDRALTLACGVAALIIAVWMIALSPFMRGLGYNAGDPDHGNAALLLLMHGKYPASAYAAAFGLVSPTLALLSSFGWPVLMRSAGPQAKLGVRIYQIGMLAVVAQDVLEFYASSTLPNRFAAAGAEAQAAILAEGRSYDLFIHIGTEIGHTVTSVGAILFGLALLRLGRGWKALAVLALVAAAVGLASVVMGVAGIAGAFNAMFAAVILYAVWTTILGVMMLLWKPRKAEAAPQPA